LLELERVIGSKHGDTQLAYENFYNQTGCGNVGTRCLQDIAETFEQRGSEINNVLGKRWEHFWDVLAGRYADPASLSGDLLGRLTGAIADLARLLDNAFEAALGQIVTLTVRMASSPPTSTDMAEHVAKLQALADDGSDFVLIAHSQGNLFVNASYDALLASRPNAKAKVVHIAPASPTVRGEHVLADIDLVINGLRVQGITSVQSININLPFSKADASGHTLVGTYLDAARAARARVKTMVQTALDAL
jgi:hypothetical protein